MNEEDDIVIVSPEQQAINEISEIAKSGLENVKQLKEINQQLSDINYHISALDDYIVDNTVDTEQLKKGSEKTDEQETKETSEETETKDRAGENTEENTEEITITEVHAEVVKVNENLQLTNSILTGNIVFLGVLAGIIIFKIMWDRFSK